MVGERINVLIVEDDPILALGLSVFLQQGGYSVAGIAGDAAEAERLFIESEVDIALIDIHITGNKDGIDTALILLKIKPVPIIYLTAVTDEETMKRMKDTYPAAFLKKPYHSSNVHISIELALHNFAAGKHRNLLPFDNAADASLVKTKEDEISDKEIILRYNDYIFIKRNYQFIKIRLDEIWYLEADKNYVYIILKDKKFTLRLSLNQAIEKISYNQLVRINRSYAVNVDAIQSFNEEKVTIAQFEISIGKNYKAAFFKQFGLR